MSLRLKKPRRVLVNQKDKGRTPTDLFQDRKKERGDKRITREKGESDEGEPESILLFGFQSLSITKKNTKILDGVL